MKVEVTVIVVEDDDIISEGLKISLEAEGYRVLTASTQADAKQVELSVDIPEGIRLFCDRKWTAEALSNIVKNCIEHTDSGGEVSVTVLQTNFSTDITVRDTGEGIAKEHLPYIFDRFYRAPGASSDSVGIGLSMSKQLIMRQNGMIEVKSELGVGTEFLVRLYRK